MFNFLKFIVRNKKLNKEWRRRNPNNQTTHENGFNFDLVSVGNYSYGGLKVLQYNEEDKLRIGHFCSIASGVVFVLSADHSIDTISSFPFKVKCLNNAEYEAVSKGDIVVDDDVWIGQNAVVLSGVHIGQGAVVAAGSVVTKDVPPYAIVGGVPAKVIKYRFEDDIISELLKVDYSKLTKEMIKVHESDLYTKLERVKQLDWLPKKDI